MKRILSILFMVCMSMTILTGCTNDAKIASDFKNDLQKDRKFMFHGLKKGITIEELLKIENIKKADVKELEDKSEVRADYYSYLADTNEKLYNIDGKVRRIYYCDDKRKYLGMAAIYFYFDDEHKFLDGCKKIGKLLYKNFGKPYSVNDAKKYDEKQAWDNFENPPKFSTWNEVENYNNSDMNYANKTMPSFIWGNPSTGNIIQVFHSENINPSQYPIYYHQFYHNRTDDKPCKYYFIQLFISINN